MASGYIDPSAPLTPVLPGAAPTDLTRGQNRALGRYQLWTMLGETGKAGKAQRRLARKGINAAETVAGYENPAILAENALHRMALQGGVQGKNAKRLKAELIQQNSLNEIDKWGQAATTYGMDEIAGQYGAAAQNLQSVLGPGVDLSSPAIASVLAGLMEGRSTTSMDYLNRLGVQQGQARQQVNEGLGGMVAQTLDETGALVEALKQLKDQQNDLANAQRGAFYGKMFAGPLGGLWGRQGALAGQNANPQMDLSSMLQLLGVGGMPGQGGATA